MSLCNKQQQEQKQTVNTYWNAIDANTIVKHVDGHTKGQQSYKLQCTYWKEKQKFQLDRVVETSNLLAHHMQHVQRAILYRKKAIDTKLSALLPSNILLILQKTCCAKYIDF